MDDVEPNHFTGGSPSCTSELNLFYVCYTVLGESMTKLTCINDILEATTEQALRLYIADPTRTKLLLHLSSFTQLQEFVFIRFREVLREMLLDYTQPQEVREALLEVIRNLSRCAANKEAIYHDFYDILFLALQEGNTLFMTRFALGALNNLATLDANAVALFQRTQFIETVIYLTRNGGTPTIKERALWTLQSLACVDENEIRMFRTPGLMDELRACLAKENTTEIKAYTIETLQNLANQNAREMAENGKLVAALFDVATSNSSPPALVNLAFSCFEKLGLSRHQIENMYKLQILCSARDAPRVCGAKCRFSDVPNELIRRIGKVLTDSDLSGVN